MPLSAPTAIQPKEAELKEVTVVKNDPYGLNKHRQEEQPQAKFDARKLNQFVGEKAYMDMARIFLQAKYKYLFGESFTLVYFCESFYVCHGFTTTAGIF